MSPEVIAAIIAASVGVLTLIGTLAAQYFGRRATSRDTEKTLKEQLAGQREQLDRTLAAERGRTLNERFSTAADKLGGDKPPAVRLAGVYAMAGLADDWPENRQTCVEVLCAYMRMPYEPDPGDEAPEAERLAFRASREVRHTVIRVITAHLNDGPAKSWQGLNLDFTGVVFDGGDFRGARFSGGEVSFRGAQFRGGEVSFQDATFASGKISFDNAKFISGPVSFGSAKFSGGEVSFTSAEFCGARVHFTAAKFSGGEVSFQDTKIASGWLRFTAAWFCGATVYFTAAEFSGGEVSFRGAGFSAGEVTFGGVKFSGGDVCLEASFSGGEVAFTGAEFTAGAVAFTGAEFTGGTVHFYGATFSGSAVDFGAARFSGGTVDLSEPLDWSFPPRFPWTNTPPSGVSLPRKEDQSQA
jgi:uncharacterized protein YjbI with pentapeptide repeats